MDEGVKIRVSGKSHPTSSEDGCVIVDKHVYDLISNKTMYWDTKGYVNISVESKLQLLHRYIYTILGNELSYGDVIHHKNGIKYDNRLDNIEPTTHSHNNAAITRKTDMSTSKYKGVSKTASGWTATISNSKRKINLGTFEDESAAAKKYDEAFVAIHGASSGNNGLLEQDDIAHILSNRDDFIPLPKRSGRKLPAHITNHQGRFRVRIRKKPDIVLYQGVFKTIEEALTFRNEKIAEIHNAKENEFRSQPINRNADGVAIIDVKIPKTQDTVHALVDDVDYYNMKKIVWHLNKGYASHSSGEMHTLVIPRSGGKVVIDHINCNKLDNRRENLREVSYSFNNRNEMKRDGCFSRFVGVSRVKGTDKWQAGINVNGKRIALGTFNCEETAAKRYKEEYDRIKADEVKSKG